CARRFRLTAAWWWRRGGRCRCRRRRPRRRRRWRPGRGRRRPCCGRGRRGGWRWRRGGRGAARGWCSTSGSLPWERIRRRPGRRRRRWGSAQADEFHGPVEGDVGDRGGFFGAVGEHLLQVAGLAVDLAEPALDGRDLVEHQLGQVLLEGAVAVAVEPV